jgi:hypothetical protein
MSRDAFVYQLILNPKAKMMVKQADSKHFARVIQGELEDLMEKIASDDKEITIDGKTFDKTTSTGALIINNKLSELEAQSTQNNSFLSFVRKTEDNLRQMLG